MSRPRAADHDEKARAILARAAERFAAAGYTGTSMAEIAAACGTSKALLYHYFPSKEALLGDLLEAHFLKLEAVVAAADDRGLAAPARLRAMVRALLEAYAGADALHKVQINELERLPPARQGALKAYERRLVARFRDAMAEINPRLAGERALLMPVVMSLFGMINWSYLWFREDGGLTRRQYADLVTQMAIDGVAGLGVGKMPVRRVRPRQWLRPVMPEPNDP
ncbi:MAG: TetR/AcrR family transcriptional regulator [Hyphomicrobiaceae bacterium]|nr:TetR/AcrR family transcriptional regulator [Hyphomicrobiaceae bacterium]